MTQFLRNRKYTPQSKRKFIPSCRPLPNEYHVTLTITNVNRTPLRLQYLLTKDGLPVYSGNFYEVDLVQKVREQVFPLAVDTNKGIEDWYMSSSCIPNDMMKFTVKEEITENHGVIMRKKKCSNHYEKGMIVYSGEYFK